MKTSGIIWILSIITTIGILVSLYKTGLPEMVIGLLIFSMIWIKILETLALLNS